VIQNNQVALGTTLTQHHRSDFKDWPESYGVWGASFDGNNILDTYAATRTAARNARSGQGPALLIGETFRMGGHATHDEEEARKLLEPALFEYWGKRDPIGCFETYLIESGRYRDDLPAALEAVEQRVVEEVERASEEALAGRKDRLPKPESAVENVYAHHENPALV